MDPSFVIVKKGLYVMAKLTPVEEKSHLLRMLS